MNVLNLAFLAPVVMAWGTIKQVFARCGSLFVASGEIRAQLADHMHSMLWQEWKVIPLGPKLHVSSWWGLKKFNGAAGPIVLSAYSGAVLFRKGVSIVVWKPLQNGRGRLSCLRGLTSYDALVEEATRRLYEQTDGVMQSHAGRGPGFRLVRFQGENVSANRGFGSSNGPPTSRPEGPTAAKPDQTDTAVELEYFGGGACPAYEIYPMVLREKSDIGCAADMPPLVRHYVDPQMEVLLREMHTWLSAVAWMRARGIPCRRGVLLEGPPGTGKSSFVKSMAEHFEVQLVTVELATCSDYDLPQLRDVSRQPSIFLFEDIDRVFEGSRNITEREADKVTFDAFLNLLSGADALQGMIILTTNHPEKLDEALLRPGRIDRRIVVPLLSSEGRLSMANRIMRGCPQELISGVLRAQADPLPAAAFENTCIQTAMEWYWQHHLSNEHQTCNDT